MRLARGTSPISARGMSENHGPYWRPLLDHSKAELIKWLNEYKILWKEDSSNQRDEYSRNKVRQQIIPPLTELYPKSKNHIIRFAQQSFELAKFAQNHLRHELSKSLVKEANQVIIPLSFFSSLEGALIHISLVDVISSLTQQNFIPESKALFKLESYIRSPEKFTGTVQLTTNLLYKIKNNSLVFLTSP